MSSSSSFIRWSSLLPICLVLLLNINSYDFTHQDMASQVDTIKSMNIEHAAHGNLTRRNSQFAMPIKRDRASLILKSLTALITTMAIALIIVRCLRQIKPNSNAQQYRRLAENDACGAVRYTPMERASDVYPSALRNGNNKELNIIDPIYKPTCEASKQANQSKHAEGYVNVALGEETNDLLRKPAPKKTMSKKMIQKAKDNKKAVILAATGTAIALIVIVALSIELSHEKNKNSSKPHSEKLSESEEYIRKDTFEALKTKYENDLKAQQTKYDTLQEKYDALQDKLEALESSTQSSTESEPLTGEQFTKEPYETIEMKYNQQKQAYNNLQLKYHGLEEQYNKATMDYTTMLNGYNKLYERNRETQRSYQTALKNDVHFVMQSLDEFRSIVKRGLNECQGKRYDAPFSGNTLNAMRLRWDVMPNPRQIPFLKVKDIYKAMEHISPARGRSISEMKPILETMETTLDTLMNPTE